MTRHDHLYGEKWRPEEENSQGLLPQLSSRLGILKKMSRYASRKNLRMLINGLFYSKLTYCLPLFMNTWGLDKYKDKGTRYFSFTKEDIRKLQVLQNQVTRLLVKRSEFNNKNTNQNMSTEELLEKRHVSPSAPNRGTPNKGIPNKGILNK